MVGILDQYSDLILRPVRCQRWASKSKKSLPAGRDFYAWSGALTPLSPNSRVDNLPVGSIECVEITTVSGIEGMDLAGHLNAIGSETILDEAVNSVGGKRVGLGIVLGVSDRVLNSLLHRARGVRYGVPRSGGGI